MVSTRDTVLKLKKYMETCNIDVNIAKNKARGNKGVFVTGNKKYRIDIAKDLNEESILSTLIHEFAHFVHYKYDNTLTSYDFLFQDNDIIKEELIKISVHYVPKEAAQSLFEAKSEATSQIKKLGSQIKEHYPQFKLSCACKDIEKNLKSPIKYFLKYDKVKILDKVYSLDNISEKNISISDIEIAYLKLKSKQRILRRINSRILRLNNYYNRPTELIARFVELYYTNNTLARELAPNCSKCMDDCRITEFNALNKIFQ